MTESIHSGRAERSTIRQQHLLAVARNLFVEYGFHQTGMAQIAASSGISVGQIYRYFRSKEEIVAAICEIHLAEWLHEESLCQAVTDTDRRAIMGWIDRFCTQTRSLAERRLTCDILSEVGRNPKLAIIHDMAKIRLRAKLVDAIITLAPDAPVQRRETLADLITAVMWGFTAELELCFAHDHEELKRYISHLIRRELTELTVA